MTRGFSLIELLIVAAVISLFFGGLFTTVQTSLRLISDTRARLSALTVASDHLEYIRSLSYDAVGTVSGLPPGLIPQVSTTSLNQIAFTRRTLIEYVDDPADGSGAADSNSITTDFKRVKVEVSWTRQGVTDSVVLISNIIPRSIETSVGGGTIRVNVTDANILPLAGMTVRLLNTSGTTTVDVTRSTDATGVALFGGAPAQANYQVFVSEPGYSSAQTYVATTSLPNPSALPLSVTEANVTTVNFQIDRISTLGLEVLLARTEASSSLTFMSTSSIASSTNTALATGALVLASSSGTYIATGEAWLTPITPTPLARWQNLVVTETLPLGTSRTIRLYTSIGGTLIPDSILPGNSVGFAGDIIDLTTLPTTIYPSIVPRVVLATANPSVTPTVTRVATYYVATQSPHSGGTFTLRGNKTIGTFVDFTPVYKTNVTRTLDSNGRFATTSLEWDTYQLQATGYDIAEACADHPITVAPNTISTTTVLLTPNTANSLRVVVTDGGVSVRDATVTVIRSGSQSQQTSGCGQAFFGGLTAAADYRIEVTAPGFSTTVLEPFDITADVVTTVNW
jgi:prepilin-type N-terminal cleavage/methylation domain-containing protein